MDVTRSFQPLLQTLSLKGKQKSQLIQELPDDDEHLFKVVINSVTTPLSIHFSLLPHLCCPAAPWLFQAISPTASGARHSLFSCSSLYRLDGWPRHNFLQAPRTGDVKVAWKEQAWAILFLTNEHSCPRMLGSFFSSLWGFCLLPPPLPEARELPASFPQPWLAQPARAALGDRDRTGHWELWGQTLAFRVCGWTWWS